MMVNHVFNFNMFSRWLYRTNQNPNPLSLYSDPNHNPNEKFDLLSYSYIAMSHDVTWYWSIQFFAD